MPRWLESCSQASLPNTEPIQTWPLSQISDPGQMALLPASHCLQAKWQVGDPEWGSIMVGIPYLQINVYIFYCIIFQRKVYQGVSVSFTEWSVIVRFRPSCHRVTDMYLFDQQVVQFTAQPSLLYSTRRRKENTFLQATFQTQARFTGNCSSTDLVQDGLGN